MRKRSNHESGDLVPKAPIGSFSALLPSRHIPSKAHVMDHVLSGEEKMFKNKHIQEQLLKKNLRTALDQVSISITISEGE